MMMGVFKIILKMKSSGDMTEETKDTLNSFENPVDYTNKKNIKTIVEAVQNRR